MGNAERVRLNAGTNSTTKILWLLGWNSAPTKLLFVVSALLGWLVLQNPIGLLFGFLALVLHWKAISVVNKTWQERLSQAESLVRDQGASRLGVSLSGAQVTVLRMGRGKPPLAVKPNPEYTVSAVYICDGFFAIYQGAIFSLASLDVQLPAQAEEVYFRHVSAVNFSPPNLEVVLSNGKTLRKFDVGTEGGGAVLGALRAKLRGANQGNTKDLVPATRQEVGVVSIADGQNERRYCYLRTSKLNRLLTDPNVLDALVEQLQVPGGNKTIKGLSAQEKLACIEAEIDHLRRTPNSVWFDVPALEVLAASLWRTNDDAFYRDKRLLTRKLVRREWFSGVSEEDDLRKPVARWLKHLGYEPYMEISLGMSRLDVLGYKKGGLTGSPRLLAVELKNDYEQFKRALNQMDTFGEYSNAVYMACTPDFAAEYLDRNEQATDNHWHRDALEQKLSAGGYGLLIVEVDQVFEVLKPVERTPTSANSARIVNTLSASKIIEC